MQAFRYGAETALNMHTDVLSWCPSEQRTQAVPTPLTLWGFEGLHTLCVCKKRTHQQRETAGLAEGGLQGEEHGGVARQAL